MDNIEYVEFNTIKIDTEIIDIIKEEPCPLCQDKLGDDYTVLGCYHVIHNSCGINWIKIEGKCPICNYVLSFT